MDPRNTDDMIMNLARIGAKAELDTIFKTFPDLRDDRERHGGLVKRVPVKVNTRLHWTQRPENAAKVAKMSRKAARTRAAARS